MVLVSSALESFCSSAGRAAISSTSGLLLDSRDPFRLSYQLIDLAIVVVQASIGGFSDNPLFK
jgi:hypothetical protein